MSTGLQIFAGVLIAAVILAAVAIRLVPMPPEVWHVDPADVTPPESPNFALHRGEDAFVAEGSLAEVAAALTAVADTRGAERIAGDLAAGHATFVERSRLVGFPDAISIRLTEADGRTRIEVFSRARFGYSDMGVNARRVAAWTAGLTLVP